jgi:hypothetical protein
MMLVDPEESVAVGAADLSLEAITSVIMQVASVMVPAASPSSISTLVSAISTAAYQAASLQYGVLEAVAWADNFVLPREAQLRDSLRLRAAGGSLSLMISRIQHERRHSRFSRERLHSLVPSDYPDLPVLLTMADGMRIFRPPGFQRRAVVPPFRKLYVSVAPAVSRVFHKLWQQNLVVILPTALLLHQPNIHFIPLHWTPKTGKQCGRQLVDASDPCSADGTMSSALNSDSVRDWARTNIGEIHHPTIIDIVLMILKFHREIQLMGFSWDDLVLFKEDLANAFSLLSFHPEDVAFMASPMLDGYSVVAHTGTFGWSAMPYYFQRITVLLDYLFELRRKIGALLARSKLFVDDNMGVTIYPFYQQDHTVIIDVCTQLLGPEAIASEKSQSGRRLDMLGFCVDLDTRTVSISEKNFNKAVYIYFSVDTNKRVSLLVLQRLASLASRYQLICPVMTPFTSALFQNQPRTSRNPSLAVELTAEAKRSIFLWRAVFCFIRWDRCLFCRRFHTFDSQAPSYLLEMTPL